MALGMPGAFEKVGVQAVVQGFGPYMQQLGTMEARTKGFGSNIGKFLKMGALVGGAAIVGLGVAGLKLGGEFDKAYDKIQIGTGATGKALEGLKGDFKAALKDLPAGMGDVSTAVADLNTRLGLTGEPLRQMTKQMVRLSDMTETDLSTNIEQVTRVFGDWGVATDDQSASLDRLFKVSQATGPSVDEIGRLMVQYGAPMRQFGFTFDEAAVLMGKFQKEGVNTELVMGALRIGLVKLAKEGEPLPEAFKRVVDEIKNAGDAAEANSKAVEIFGARAGPDMAAAIREGRFEIEDLLGQLGDSEGAILDTAAATDDWTEKLKILKNKALVALEPALMAMFDGLTKLFTVIEKKVIPAMQQWWKRHGPGIVQFLKGDLLPTIRDIGRFLKDFFAPALDTVNDLWTNLAPILEQYVLPPLRTVGKFLLEHKPLLIAVAAAILLLTNPWLAVAVAIAVVLAKWDEISAFFIEIGKAIDRFIKKVLEIPVIGAIFKDTFETVKAVVETAFRLITNRIKFFLDTIKNTFAFWKAIFSGDWGAAWNALKAQAGAIWKLIGGDFGALLDGFKAILGSKLGMLKTIGSDIVKAIGEGLRGALGWAKGALNSLITIIERGVNKVIGLINAIPDIKLPFGMGSIGVPYIPPVSIGRLLHKGAWDIPRDMLARLQAGEMVLPRPQAQVVRESVLAPSVAPQAAGIAGGGVDPQALAAAVASALQGMTVTMDGRVVGNLVSERLGSRSFMLRRGG